MAVAFRSVATTNIADRDGGAWSVTITKPTGLTAGDYMVAIIGTSTNASSQAVSGWTLLGEQQNGVDTRIIVYGKVADSADASASDFTFAVHSGNGGSEDGMGGCLIAVSGTSPVTSSVFIDFGTGNAGATTYSGGITPSLASLLIMGAWGQGSASTTVDSYAIATDNPTWTERMDDTEALGTSDYTLAVATAPRTETTATGDFSLTFSNSMNSAGVLLAVLEMQNASVSPAVVSLVGTIQAPAVSGGATVSPAVVTMSASVIDPTVTTPANKWTNPDKNSASWTNPDKTV